MKQVNISDLSLVIFFLQPNIELVKNSQLRESLELLKIVKPLKVWRNKRYAHLDDEGIAIVSCNLHDYFLRWQI